jgi:phosphoribosylanthranilate isomerase
MKSIEEVWMAIEAGASAIGLVSPMPSGPGPISNETAAEIAAEVPPGIDAFLLTPLQTVEELVEQNRLVKARTLQLVDRSRSRRPRPSPATSTRSCWTPGIRH